MIRNKKVLITGAGGFLGIHLCSRLEEEGAIIHATTRNLDQSVNNSPYQWYRGDLSDSKFVEGIFSAVRPQIIYHLAGYPYGARDRSLVIPALNDNTITTINILNAACDSGCEKVILCGSMEEPGAGENTWVARSPYAVSKYCATLYAQMFHTLYDLPVVTLRLFMIYGPGQQGAHLNKLIPYLILSFLKKQQPHISAGTRLIDWIYVDDVVDSIIHATTAKKAIGQVIDIGSGTQYSIKTMVEKIINIIRPDIQPVYGAVKQRQYESEEIADIERAFAILKWRAKNTVEEGLAKTVAWYHEHLDEFR